ncbi:MAG TPA: TonB family protein [Gammaproteobacteria bacterium]|nr:TonB family protein [Gammaproteobacteria bacterium]
MVYSHSLTLAWTVSADEERRFRRVLVSVLVFTIALGIAIPYLPVFKKPVEQQIELPPRVAKLIFEKKTQPKPPKVVKKKPKPKEVVKKKAVKKKKPTKVAKKPKQKPKVDRTERARKKAASAGLLAMQDALADLRDQSVDELKGSTRLSNSGAKARRTERALITSKVGGASGGINTSALSRDTGSTRLASRTATRVSSPVAPDAARRSKRGKHGASRSIEEIQIVFDRNKSAIYSLYNRALRKDPSLQGKLVIRLTIAPSGKVTRIELVSSELASPPLERKLIQRVKMFNFGAKPVEAVTITYPIDFLPA